jgi:hypothetical protein
MEPVSFLIQYKNTRKTFRIDLWSSVFLRELLDGKTGHILIYR